MKQRFIPRLLLAALAFLLPACASHYVVPGGGADFHALGITKQQADDQADPGIAAKLQRKPLAGFPAVIAAIRVQDRGYRSYTASGYGEGPFTVVTTRDVETPEQIDRLQRLPMVRAIVPINRLVCTSEVSSERHLRDAAASVQADLVLLYTFDTKFGHETTIPALGTITLGLFPNEEARVTTTASAAILDTRSGYIYALAEATAKRERLTNAWNTESAIDQARRGAETEAFDKLVGEVESSWKGVVERYAVTAPSRADLRPIDQSQNTVFTDLWQAMP